MNVRFVFASAVWCLSALAQDLPKPEAYPVKESFQGTPAAAKIASDADKRFRTRIREGAMNGPNFADHFTIIQWGCGAGCISMAVADAKDGKVYEAPFKNLAFTVPNFLYEGKHSPFDDRFQAVGYKRNSSLLMVRGCPEEKDCGTYFYQWLGTKFQLVQKVAATPMGR